MPPGPGVVALVGLNVAPSSSIVIGACIDKLFAMSTIKKFFKEIVVYIDVICSTNHHKRHASLWQSHQRLIC
jgi:hypothetical protein